MAGPVCMCVYVGGGVSAFICSGFKTVWNTPVMKNRGSRGLRDVDLDFPQVKMMTLSHWAGTEPRPSLLSLSLPSARVILPWPWSVLENRGHWRREWQGWRAG